MRKGKARDMRVQGSCKKIGRKAAEGGGEEGPTKGKG